MSDSHNYVQMTTSEQSYLLYICVQMVALNRFLFHDDACNCPALSSASVHNARGVDNNHAMTRQYIRPCESGTWAISAVGLENVCAVC